MFDENAIPQRAALARDFNALEEYSRTTKGDGIPATSFAAGRNSISGSCVAGNILMSPDETLPWPRIVDDQRKWYHSDICNLAFFYVHPIFKKFNEGDFR